MVNNFNKSSESFEKLHYQVIMQNTASLVKYNTPMMVSFSGSGTGLNANIPTSGTVMGNLNNKHPGTSSNNSRTAANNGKTKHSNDKQSSATEDILNSILPPREWTENGQLWVQYVSSTPATRLDVVNLQEKLDHSLQSRQARETGICPIRAELYSQCFDELIRQITINCAERGLLLLRVRDEAKMTISAYETLYESSIAYGIREALIAEQKKIDLDLKIKQLQGTNKDLKGQVENLKKTIESTIARAAEKREAEERAHNDEVERIHRTNDQLKTSLEALLSAPRK